MPTCPKCTAEIDESDGFCRRCGTKLTEAPQNQFAASSATEDDVKNAVVKRLEAIRNKDEAAVKALIGEGYNKFDDWPPFERQETVKALENEFAAFKVLSNYSYEITGFEANLFRDAAVATFTLRYKAVLRNRTFDVTSRVTSILKMEDSGWKIVHEHYSRFPDLTQQQFGPRRTMQP